MAKEQPENVTSFCASSVYLLMILLKPTNHVVLLAKNKMSRSSVSTEQTLKEKEQSLRGQELIYMVEEAEREGVLDTEDPTLITNAITWRDLTAWDILTPRVDVVSVPL